MPKRQEHVRPSLLMQRLGAVIRRRRFKQKLLQRSVAESSDVDRVFYGLLERGRKNASVETLERIARVLSVRLSRMIAEAELENARKKPARH